MNLLNPENNLVDLPIGIRAAEPQDYAFVLTSWSQEARKIKPDSYIPNSIFYPRQKTLINNLIKNSITLVAHLDEDRDFLLGYLVATPKNKTLYLHWSFVKPLYRRQGICKSLLQVFSDHSILVVTSPFLLLPQFKKKFNFIYDPSVIDSYRV